MLRKAMEEDQRYAEALQVENHVRGSDLEVLIALVRHGKARNEVMVGDNRQF